MPRKSPRKRWKVGPNDWTNWRLRYADTTQTCHSTLTWSSGASARAQERFSQLCERPRTLQNRESCQKSMTVPPLTIGRPPLWRTLDKLPGRRSDFWSCRLRMTISPTLPAVLTNGNFIAIARRGGMTTAKLAEMLTAMLVISTEMVLDTTRIGTRTLHWLSKKLNCTQRSMIDRRLNATTATCTAILPRSVLK